MVRIKTQGFYSDNLDFKYEVNVDTEGNFTTTIPKNIVEMFEKIDIKLQNNRLNHPGFFSAKSLEELNEQVQELAMNYSKKELVESKVILEYSIDTTCNYCKGKKGLYPDGNWQQDAEGGDDFNWVEGSSESGSFSCHPFGFKIYVDPKFLEIWKFSNGEIKKEYSRVDDENIGEDKVLDWLCSIRNLGDDSNQNLKEIDYTPEIGLFFKKALSHIFNINEGIIKMFGGELDLSKIDINTLPLLEFSGKKEPSEVQER